MTERKNLTMADFQASANYVKAVLQAVAQERKSELLEPKLGLILGSALGSLADEITERVEIAYKDIPSFLLSTAPGHAGKLIIGKLHGHTVCCFSGRFHYYEGYDFEQLVIPVRLLKLLGCSQLILTNAAGGINENYHTGDLMIIKDHLKLFGASPLRGQNLPEFGVRFFDTSDMYSKRLRALALEAAKKTTLRVHEGIYNFYPGPQYESPAEIRAFRLLGADATGMSTVTEALTAAHCGIEVLGISMISNMAAGITGVALTEEEVIEAGEQFGAQFKDYLQEILRLL